MSSLKIIFAGTPDFAAQHLQHIAAHSTHTVCAVYTQPDRPKGRGKKLEASPVKTLAETLNIPVLQPLSLTALDTQNILRSFGADIMVVVAYGLILPEAILTIPRLGCINVHASLLPRWRGAAPIERAIEAGDSKTGVTLMQMGVGLDDGAILLQTPCAISSEDTGESLRKKLAVHGCTLLLQGLYHFATNTIPHATQQNHAQANYAHKLNKVEAQISWYDSAHNTALKIRAFNSHNICYSTLHQQRLKIYSALAIEQMHTKTPGTIIQALNNGIDVACGKDVLRITHMQLPGGKVLHVRDILNSRAAWFVQDTLFN